MARLIDADKMREDWLENGENEYVYDTNAVLESIDEQPTVDAVEVVRCKDCKFNVANMAADSLDSTDYSDITCSYFMTDGMDAGDFCSRGEQMDGGDKE